MRTLVILRIALALSVAYAGDAEDECDKLTEASGALSEVDNLVEVEVPADPQQSQPDIPTMPANSPLAELPSAIDSVNRKTLYRVPAYGAIKIPFNYLRAFLPPGAVDSISYQDVPQNLPLNELYKVGALSPDTILFAGGPLYGPPRVSSNNQILDIMNFSEVPVHGGLQATADIVTGPSPAVEAGTLPANTMTLTDDPLYGPPRVALGSQVPDTINFGGVPVHGTSETTGSSPAIEDGADSLAGSWSPDTFIFSEGPLYGPPRARSIIQIPHTIKFGRDPVYGGLQTKSAASFFTPHPKIPRRYLQRRGKKTNCSKRRGRIELVSKSCQLPRCHKHKKIYYY